MPEYHYFVDQEKVVTEQPHATGAEIKSRLHPDKRSKPLYLEGHGDAHPTEVTDDLRVSFEEGPKYFATKFEQPKFPYFIDGEKFESTDANTLGSVIRSKLSENKRTYAVFLEGQGNEPDELINTDSSICLAREKPCRFYTVPPASFGTNDPYPAAV